jgi:hypothetical protein
MDAATLILGVATVVVGLWGLWDSFQGPTQ